MASKTIAFSKSVALPANADRKLAISMLHDHGLMIELNPQVFSHKSIKTPRDAPSSESSGHQWHQLSEDISHFQGSMSRTTATYKACYLNLPDGIDFHIYGPQGLDVKERWTLAHSPTEHDAYEWKTTNPSNDLYLRRDCNLNCPTALPSLAEISLYQAHQTFVQKLADKMAKSKRSSPVINTSRRSWSLRSFGRFSRSSRDVSTDRASSRTSFVSALDPSDIHPAFRNQMDWSLVSDQDHNDRDRRTQSMYIDDSPQTSKSLRRRPNFPTTQTDSAVYQYRHLASPAELSQNVLPLPEKEEQYQTSELSLDSQPSTGPSIDSADDAARYLDSIIEEHMKSVTKRHSIDEDSINSPTGSAPSLIDETSDEESSVLPDLPATPSEEVTKMLPDLPSPSSEMSVLDVIRQLRDEMGEAPPPLPKRAEGHTVPAPLCIRSVVVPDTRMDSPSLPIDLLPLRSTSVRGSKAYRRSSKRHAYRDIDRTSIYSTASHSTFQIN